MREKPVHWLGFLPYKAVLIWHAGWMARTAKLRRRLWDAYCFPGFWPEPTVRGIFGDPKARVISLKRRSKNAAAVGWVRWAGTTARSVGCAIYHAGHADWNWRCGALTATNVGRKRERLEFLADNPFYTKRFAYFVGRRCRQASIADVAKELALDWHTVKALENARTWRRSSHMRALRAHGRSGIDEIAIRKGHSSLDLSSATSLRGRPIWFGGKDRSEASRAQFYAWLGAKKSARASALPSWTCGSHFGLGDTGACAKIRDFISIEFHIMRHLGEPLIRSARASMRGSPAATGATSRARNTPSSVPRREKFPHARWQESIEDLNWRLSKAAQHSLYAQGESLASFGAMSARAGARRFFKNWRASLKVAASQARTRCLPR